MSICTCNLAPQPCLACLEQAAKHQEQTATKECTCEVINSINVGFEKPEYCLGQEEDEEN